MSVQVRPSLLADSEQIISGINSICAEELYFVTDYFIADAQWRAALAGENQPNALLAVVEWNGVFAGSGNIFPGSLGRKDRHVGKLGMYILPPYRGAGLGSALLRWMLDWAQASSLCKLSLAVLATNRRAIHLYEKFGFTTEGTLRAQYRIAGQWVDSVLMAKFLKAID